MMMAPFGPALGRVRRLGPPWVRTGREASRVTPTANGPPGGHRCGRPPVRLEQVPAPDIGRASNLEGQECAVSDLIVPTLRSPGPGAATLDERVYDRLLR